MFHTLNEWCNVTSLFLDLPKGKQYAAIFPDRGLSVRCVPESRTSSLKEIKKEAEVFGARFVNLERDPARTLTLFTLRRPVRRKLSRPKLRRLNGAQWSRCSSISPVLPRCLRNYSPATFAGMQLRAIPPALHGCRPEGEVGVHKRRFFIFAVFVAGYASR